MQIVGIEDMSMDELAREIRKGGRFVIYLYVISIVFLTFKQPTNIHFVKVGEGSFGRSLGPTVTTLLLGWWGIPFGIIYSIEALFVNFSGGRDVTADVMASLARSARGY